jgi:tripartite-type tricarboxylate transporter receptor subunit TctC
MKQTRRHFLQLLAVAAAGAPFSTYAQSYPARFVTMIVPASAGGTTDIVARLVSEYLSQDLGQQFIVENVSGASGNMANTRVARAAADGYTLLMSYSGYHVANPHLFKTINWDPVKSFTPLGLAVKAPHVILVSKDLPVTDLKSFIAYAKANPGKINYASSGIGSIQHIGGEQLKKVAGIEMTHVPYRGAGPAMNDLIAGTVQLFITTPPSAVGHLQAGLVKALALAAAERHPMLPDLPTTAEVGLPGYELVAWFALFAPAGLDPAIRQRLATALEATVNRAQFKAKVEAQGAYAAYLGPDQLAQLTEKELSFWGGVIKDAGISAE